MDIAVITGASSGMGEEFVKAIDRDYDLDEIWIIARRKERLEALGEKCRNTVRVLAMDLTDPSSFSVYEELLKEDQPRIRLLVNSAGKGFFGRFTDMPLQEQLSCVDLNDKALAAMCYISLPYMDRDCSIINLGSNSSWQPVPFQNMYASTKAFVLSFSRGLGRELKPRGIHVMCVCPGWIDTEFIDLAKTDDTISYFDRWYTPEQVVEKAMKDLKKKKKISILGLPVRLQVMLVKHLPAGLVMNIWCRQQKQP